MGELFDQMLRHTWSVFALPSLLLLAFAEIGRRLGDRVYAARDEARKGTIGGIQGAVLGLLGLLLGFTFAMAVSRYDARRLLVLDESNAIGTTFLRASLLPEAHVEPVQDLLRRYVALRIEYTSTFEDAAKFQEGLQKSAELQRRLWEHVEAAAKEAPTPIVATFVTSLNETIDLEATRIAAARARIPLSIWILLLIVAAFGCMTSGYAAGAAGGKSGFSGIVLPLLIAVVLTLIFDLMHPRQGFIGLSQQPMIDLQQSIAPPSG